MKLAVVGASGVLGRQVVPRLLARGHTVRALIRPGSGGVLPKPDKALECVSGDLFDSASLRRLLAGCDAAHLATALRLEGRQIDWSINDRVRREGTAGLLAACETAGVGRYVQQSVAFIDPGQELSDGTGALAALPFLASAVEMEAMVRQAPLSTLVLRGGAFCGPGTAMDAWLGQSPMNLPVACPGDGQDWVSLIHVEDMADAVVAALEATTTTGCLAIVGDAPVRWGDLSRRAAALLGYPGIAFGGRRLLPSFRVSNSRARALLNWAPAHHELDATILSASASTSPRAT